MCGGVPGEIKKQTTRMNMRDFYGLSGNTLRFLSSSFFHQVPTWNDIKVEYM
jgi:hypothetical protein